MALQIDVPAAINNESFTSTSGWVGDLDVQGAELRDRQTWVLLRLLIVPATVGRPGSFDDQAVTTSTKTPRTKPAPCWSASRVPNKLPATLVTAITPASGHQTSFGRKEADRRHIAGQVHQLGSGRGMQEVVAQHAHEQEDEVAGARPEEAVVKPTTPAMPAMASCSARPAKARHMGRLRSLQGQGVTSTPVSSQGRALRSPSGLVSEQPRARKTAGQAQHRQRAPGLANPVAHVAGTGPSPRPCPRRMRLCWCPSAWPGGARKALKAPAAAPGHPARDGVNEARQQRRQRWEQKLKHQKCIGQKKGARLTSGACLYLNVSRDVTELLNGFVSSPAWSRAGWWLARTSSDVNGGCLIYAPTWVTLITLSG